MPVHEVVESVFSVDEQILLGCFQWIGVPTTSRKGTGCRRRERSLTAAP